ncbi:MAG TPA: hypothetical protein VLM91_28180 [Candidatus Methylomirabilis sp.]|nr:hypothetical protein [Candidatus Methylomirabilis sp.]
MKMPKERNAVGVVALLILIGVLWGAHLVGGAENQPLKGPARFVLENYEGIQKALAADSMTGIPERARTIARAIRTDVANTLPLTVAEDAEKLAEAKDLKAARRAFKPLSASLIAWLEENQAGSSGYQEAYCPMADANWLQKEEQINNPYLGKKMLNCGEFDRHF